jgi:hypothetical protein
MIVEQICKTNFYYCRITKTASSYLIHIFKKYGYNIPDSIAKIHTANIEESPIDLSKYIKFTFVRNPYDRFISGLIFLKMRNMFDFNMDIDDCILLKKNNNIDVLNQRFIHVHLFEKQVDFLKYNDKPIEMDFIGKFENLFEDILRLFELLQIPVDYEFHLNEKNKKFNKSVKNTGWEFYDYLTQNSLEYINENFKEDFEAFNYKMCYSVDELKQLYKNNI